MAQLNGRLPLSYRAYRYPHRRGRLTRRWRAPARIASAASVGLGVLLAVAAFTTVLGISSVAYVAGDLTNVKELKSAPLALSTFISDRSGTQLLYTLTRSRRSGASS